MARAAILRQALCEERVYVERLEILDELSTWVTTLPNSRKTHFLSLDIPALLDVHRRLLQDLSANDYDYDCSNMINFLNRGRVLELDGYHEDPDEDYCRSIIDVS